MVTDNSLLIPETGSAHTLRFYEVNVTAPAPKTSDYTIQQNVPIKSLGNRCVYLS